MTEAKAGYLLVALVMAAAAAIFLSRGEAVAGPGFIDREARPGCFWLVIGLYILGAIGFVLRAIFS